MDRRPLHLLRSRALNTLYYCDNLEILRRYGKDETVDLVYLDPPARGDRSPGTPPRWPASLPPAPPLARRHDPDRVRAAPAPGPPRPPHPGPPLTSSPLSRRARPLCRLGRSGGPGWP